MLWQALTIIFYQLNFGSFQNVETDLAAHGCLPAHQWPTPSSSPVNAGQG